MGRQNFRFDVKSEAQVVLWNWKQFDLIIKDESDRGD